MPSNEKSEAHKHVEWCLKKAEKELKEGKDHKGLLKVDSDMKLAKDHITKAEHNLKALLHNQNSFSDWSINMGFYAMYHCCLALLAKFGYASKNQQCTLSAIEMLIEEKKIDASFKEYIEKMQGSNAKEERILPMREDTQYTPVLSVEAKKVKELLALCQDMIDETKGIIG